jgi:dipeptidyl-peptidase-4
MNSSQMPRDTFPRQHARTQRLTLGEPRNIIVAPSGERVLFARSSSGSDPVNKLWVLDIQTGIERCVFDPGSDSDNSQTSAEEKRRRERVREAAGGVVSFATDSAVTKAVTTVGGHTFEIDLVTGTQRVLPVPVGAFDVRLSPAGDTVAYVRDGALCIMRNDVEQILCSDSDSDITWGTAEFIAAEEMGRQRGYWFSPDGDRIAVCRVDSRSVLQWHISDSSRPEAEPSTHRYPKAGSTNAAVSLHIVSVSGGATIDVSLPPDSEYLNSVSWFSNGLVAQTQTRNQCATRVMRVDEHSGECSLLHEEIDALWVELVPGTPALAHDGSLITCGEREGSRCLLVDGRPVTPPTMQVRSVHHVGRRVLFTANDIAQPWFMHVHSFDLETTSISRLSPDDSVTTASGNDSHVVLRMTSTRSPLARHQMNNGLLLTSHAETPLVSPNVQFHLVGPRQVPVAILTPKDGSTHRLPVLFDPYGGPHAQRVVASNQALAVSQWFADQGFVVVVADGAGTPGKGSTYEREVAGDLSDPVLKDQCLVASVLPQLEPRADMSRVAIRGWSFGGYLAALAVLREPTVFHCAVAGAPVTDWRLYDTHYTERYLGDPVEDSGNYDRTSLIRDAPRLTRPLLLIHGLADDNVVAAHTLQLSSALLSAGKPHEVLPLSGVTHMTPQEVVAENLLLHQLDFIRRSLGIDHR